MKINLQLMAIHRISFIQNERSRIRQVTGKKETGQITLK